MSLRLDAQKARRHATMRKPAEAEQEQECKSLQYKDIYPWIK
jgi:hypothetical protein